MRTAKAISFNDFKQYIPVSKLESLSFDNIVYISKILNVPMTFILKELANKKISTGITKDNIKISKKKRKINLEFDAPDMFDYYWIWKKFFCLE